MREDLNGRGDDAETIDAPRDCSEEKLNGPGGLIPCLAHKL